MSNAEYLVHLFRMNRLSVCRCFVVCIIGNLNDTRYRDGVKVLWCHSHLVWFVPSLHALVLIQKIFCDLFLLFSFVCLFVLFFFFLLFFFFVLFRNGKREEGRQDAWSITYMIMF